MTPAKPDPPAAVKATLKWYELDLLAKYRDLFLAIGFLVLICSVAVIGPASWRIFTIPIAGILFGAGLMRLGWLMAEK